jgi:outer membrane protein insertion porin family
LAHQRPQSLAITAERSEQPGREEGASPKRSRPARKPGLRRARRAVSARLAIALLVLATATWAAAQGTPRVYVRRIEFLGVSRTDDEVLRRELVQFESAYLNTVALDVSLDRLANLPYVASATAALRPVDGDPQLVDIEISIVELPARRYGVGGAYSGALRGRLHGYFVNENVLGSGQRLALRAEGNDLFFASEIAYTEPYARLDGVSRALVFARRSVERLTVDSSRLDADLDSARLEYGYAVARRPARTALERDRRDSHDGDLRFGVELRRVEIAAGAAASDQLREWVTAAVDQDAIDAVPRGAFTESELSLQWRGDARDRAAFPASGWEQSLGVRATLPGSDVRYYRIDYDATRYWPLGERWVASLRARLGFGASYDDALPSLPPYFNWLAGGPNTVRGYRDGTLGPRDSLARPFGGNLLVSAQAEWLTPWPRRWQERVRAGFAFDVGNVFATGELRFADEHGSPLDYGFDAAELRQSVGLVARVRIPAGVLGISYAVPLDPQRDGGPFRRDDIERLQLTVDIEL